MIGAEVRVETAACLDLDFTLLPSGRPGKTETK